jgi:hypothetical protein
MLVAADGKIISLTDDAWDARPDPVQPRIEFLEYTALIDCESTLQLFAWLADTGRLKPVCDPEDVFELGDYDKALDKLRNHTRGQVVLKLDSEPPFQLIRDLKRYGDEILPPQRDSNDKNIKGAWKKEPLELLEFARWLFTAGSNDRGLPQYTISSEIENREAPVRPPGHMSTY